MNTQNAPAAFQISHVAIRQDDQGRYCLNDLHKASGNEIKHRPQYWLALQQTKELIEEIEKDGIPSFSKTIGRHGSTYVVKELVYSYAMWISAKFHLQVIRAYDAQQTQPLPNGLKRGRKTGSPEALTITPLELDALIDERVKKVLEGELELKADCPKYHYPLSDWQPQNNVSATGWLTFRELFRVEPGQRPSARLIKQHQAEGDDVGGVALEVDALYLLAESFYIKLDRMRSLLGDFDQRGLNIRTH